MKTNKGVVGIRKQVVIPSPEAHVRLGAPLVFNQLRTPNDDKRSFTMTRFRWFGFLHLRWGVEDCLPETKFAETGLGQIEDDFICREKRGVLVEHIVFLELLIGPAE